MSLSIATSIGFKLDNRVGTITLNRAEARNAISEEMFVSLLTILKECRENESLQILIIEADGEIFCAGGDVQFFQQLLLVDPSERMHMLTRYIELAHKVILALAKIPCFTIAAVRGAAAGYGMSLACAADLLLVEQGTKFIPAYAALGTTPDGGMTYRLPKMIGEKRAMEVLGLNRPVSADDALAWGLANQVAPSGELEKVLATVVTQFSRGSKFAQHRLKALSTQHLLPDLAAQLDRELESFLLCAGTADFLEGVKAFLEKRTAVFGVDRC